MRHYLLVLYDETLDTLLLFSFFYKKSRVTFILF